jgi:hypothetical protein
LPEFESTEYSGAESGKVEREGLPPGYRMRADAHYVDSLNAPRGDRARENGRSAAADEPARPGADRRLLDQLADDVAAIESAASLLAGERSPLARRVGLDLIKAQSARAAWLLRANAVSAASELDAQARRRLLRDVISQVRDRAGVECRLVGVTLDADASADAGVSLVPEAVLSAGLTGAIMAQLGLLEGAEGAVLRVRAAVASTEISAIAIDISQDVAGIPAGSQNRFFDAAWVARPGGWLAATGAATARVAAERVGGTIALITAERRGCTIRLTLP